MQGPETSQKTGTGFTASSKLIKKIDEEKETKIGAGHMGVSVKVPDK